VSLVLCFPVAVLVLVLVAVRDLRSDTSTVAACDPRSEVMLSQQWSAAPSWTSCASRSDFRPRDVVSADADEDEDEDEDGYDDEDGARRN
jgi:hypothetical protein